MCQVTVKMEMLGCEGESVTQMVLWTYVRTNVGYQCAATNLTSMKLGLCANKWNLIHKVYAQKSYSVEKNYSGFNIDAVVIDDPVNENDAPALAVQVTCEDFDNHFKECSKTISPNSVCMFAAVSCGHTASEAYFG